MTDAGRDPTLKRGTSVRSGADAPPLPPEAQGAPASARIDKFIRTEKLGAGGMGEVWKAWDTELGRWVALKFLRGVALGDEDVARFRREAQTAGRLSHPNIAAIYEARDEYIAMQFVEGETLRARPRNDRREIVRFVRDAAVAVQFAHEHGIVHRDLKPENVMVTPQGHVYVMDFGLARAVEGDQKLSVSGSVVGTPSYMPPEQARGEKADARSDVYSLGATLYELLTDRVPFRGANVYEVTMALLTEEPRPPRRVDPSIDADLETIVLKCLEKERARRYATARDLADDLGRWLAGEPISARPVSGVARAWRRIRRNRALSAALAAVVVVALTGAVLLVRQARGRERGEARLKRLSTLWMDVIQRKQDLRSGKVAPAKARDGLQAATGAIDAFIAEDPTMPQAWYLRARARYYLDRYDEAEADAREALRLAPDFALPRTLLGIIHLARAQNALVTVVGGAKKGVDEALEAARREFDAAGTPDAERWGMIATTEDEIMSVLARALTAVAHGRTSEGFLLLKQAVEERRAEEYAFWIAVFAPSGEGEPWFSKAIEWAPGFAWAWFARGSVKVGAGDLKGARADLEEAVRLDPRHYWALNNLGYVRRKLGVALAKQRRLDEAGAEWDAAIAMLSEAIRLYPDRPSAHFVLANTHMARAEELKRRRRPDADPEWRLALKGFDEAIRLNPTDAAAHLNRATIRHAMGDAEGARAGYDEAERHDPSSAEAAAGRGLLLADRAAALAKGGRRDDAIAAVREAIREFDTAVQRAPASAHMRRQRAQSNHTLGELLGAGDEAQSAWRQSMLDAEEAVRCEDGAESRAARGNAYLVHGERLDAAGRRDEAVPWWDRAIADYREALRADPENVDAHSNLGIALQGKGDLDGAIREFVEAARLQPDSAERHFNCGQARRRRMAKLGTAGMARELDAAIADFSEAIRLDAAYTMAWVHRGQLRHLGGDFDGAIADYGEAIRLSPRDAKLYSNRAESRTQRATRLTAAGRHEEAAAEWDAEIVDLEEASRLDPSNAVAHYNRGLARIARNDARGALEDFDKAVRARPDFPDAYTNRGLTRNALGDTRGAVEDLETALKVAPKDWTHRARVEQLLEAVRAKRPP